MQRKSLAGTESRRRRQLLLQSDASPLSIDEMNENNVLF